jgi:3-dehydrosphinganine reductase
MVNIAWPYFVAVPLGLISLVFIYFLFVIERVPKFRLNQKYGKTKTGRVHVFITGGSSGIGLATAKLLIEKSQGNINLTIIARDQAKLIAAQQELSRVSAEAKILAISCDCSKADEVRSTIDRSAAANGPVDLLIAAAGVAKPAYFEQSTNHDFEWQMQVNFFGVVYPLRFLLPHMRQNGGGRVVLISSMAGQSGIIGYAAYSASKFALRGLAESLHMEYLPHNIAFTLVNPPDVDTPMLHEEHKIRPIECNKISEGAGLFTAQQIAHDILNSVENWKFLVQTGFDGVNLGFLSGGTSPAHSAVYSTLEFLFAGVIRTLSVAYRAYYNHIVLAEHRKRGGNPGGSSNKDEKKE